MSDATEAPAAAPTETATPALQEAAPSGERSKAEALAAAQARVEARQAGAVAAAEAPTDAAISSPPTTEAPPEVAQVAADPSIEERREIRRFHLEQSRAKRKADEAYKRSRAEADLARQARQAVAGLGQPGYDPRNLPRAFGIDPDAFGRAYVETAIREHQVTDPAVAVAREEAMAVRREIEERIAAREQQVQNREDQIHRAHVLGAEVLPAVADPDRFETLHRIYGGPRGAAQKVYQETERLWQETGRVFPFQVVAADMERRADEKFEQALEQLKTSKKYGSRIAAQVAAASAQAGAPPTKSSPAEAPKTLTNGIHSPTPGRQAPASPPPGTSKKQFIESLVAKHETRQ
jgi:hypothetical protein